jgi:hypothetical protein
MTGMMMTFRGFLEITMSWSMRVVKMGGRRLGTSSRKTSIVG